MNQRLQDSHLQRVATDFDRLASLYDQLWTARLYDELIINTLPDNPAQILEVGCGTGSLLSELSDLTQYAIGIDISTEMIRIAREKNPQDNVKIQHHAVEDIDEILPSKSCDAIIAECVLHHCRDLNKVISKLINLLTSGGHLIVLEVTKTRNSQSNTLLTSAYRRVAYCISVLKYGLRKGSLLQAAKGLRDEAKLFRTQEWQQHIENEPNFSWRDIKQIMEFNNLNTNTKRINNNFIVIKGIK